MGALAMKPQAATVARAAAALAAVWLGVMVCIAFMAAPAAFALVPREQAGLLVGRWFAQEAALSLAAAAMLFGVTRQRARVAAQAGRGSVISGEVLLVLGALFCTVLGYYALQPMMAQARLGQGRWSFGALHGVSLMLFGLKGLVVGALAWRLSKPAA
ncbi:MAG: hypothetical protein RJA98_2001 [Pseudomonadota bacterium]|jgi:hypothetical protein